MKAAVDVGPVPLSAWLEQIQGRRIKNEGEATSPATRGAHPGGGGGVGSGGGGGGALLDVDGIINRLKSNMQSSVRRRQAEPSFDCKNCGKKYTLKNNLLRHTRLECGKEPQFPCPFCPHRSKRNDRLMQHVSSQHKEQLYAGRLEMPILQ
ncbi:Longitudinals lacking protein, isoform G [Frankliniella fusca]|uniref:Longitudinals lacking protein, isoform G n=1 Tax=Frankliniella fusca TaxID=407009 RepID=A0AAE1H611_9NEOP|nr:Longitudinals lacking protein, isoform G [Frankliniella fusca]